MTNFSGLSIALAGLRSARRQMDVAAQNVANAQNPEYARRRLVNGSTPPAPGALPMAGPDGLFSQRITDQFYEQRAITESSVAQHLTSLAGLLGGLEQAVPEPSANGIAAAMSGFFGALDDVAQNPTQLPVRQAALAKAQDLAHAYNQVADEMSRVRADVVARLQTLADDTNSLADRLAALNQSVLDATAAGGDPAEFLDQRDAIVRQLAEKVGARIEPGPQGTISAFLGNSTLVSGSKANHLQPTDDGTTAGLTWVGPNFTGAVTGQISGDAAAYLEMVNTRIPTARAGLDAAALDLANQVNTLHTAGYGLDGSTALELFTGTGAGDLAVNQTVLDNPAKLAAGSTASPMDSSVITRIADLGADPNGPLAEFRSFVATLGSAVKGAQQLAAAQVSVLGQIDAARTAARGVSVDEEAASLIQFQRSYQASAKVIQVFDTTMDALMSIVR